MFIHARTAVTFAVMVVLSAEADPHHHKKSLRSVSSYHYRHNKELSFLDGIIYRLFNFNKNEFRSRLEANLKKKIGFSVLGESSSNSISRDLKEAEYDNSTVASHSATGNYTFSQCPEEYECDSTIATYNRDEVYNVISSVLRESTNVPYCLTADPRITKDMYGQCGVEETCACAFCLFGSMCLGKVCDSECYDLSGVDTE
jgi:hypothetical protein